MNTPERMRNAQSILTEMGHPLMRTALFDDQDSWLKHSVRRRRLDKLSFDYGIRGLIPAIHVLRFRGQDLLLYHNTRNLMEIEVSEGTRPIVRQLNARQTALQFKLAGKTIYYRWRGAKSSPWKQVIPGLCVNTAKQKRVKTNFLINQISKKLSQVSGEEEASTEIRADLIRQWMKDHLTEKVSHYDRSNQFDVQMMVSDFADEIRRVFVRVSKRQARELANSFVDDALVEAGSTPQGKDSSV